MANTNFSPNPFGAMLTRWVRRLLIANCAVFVALFVLRLVTDFPLEEYLVLLPSAALQRPWTLITYMFVHAGPMHLLMNMLGLFFFGPVLEDRWGSREFIKFYAICGLAGALLSFIFINEPIAGASAAIIGIMVAFAMYWPDSPIYIWGVFPIKAKWLVTGLVALNLFALRSGGSGVANLAHLGGAVAAFGYLKSPWAPSAFGEVYKPRKKMKSRSWTDLIPRRRRKIAAEPARAARPLTTEPRRPLDDVDRILDKISADGINSLTAEERRRLEDASRRLGTN
jgi:membrane associated rhomboid family serine protease